MITASDLCPRCFPALGRHRGSYPPRIGFMEKFDTRNCGTRHGRSEPQDPPVGTCSIYETPLRFLRLLLTEEIIHSRNYYQAVISVAVTSIYIYRDRYTLHINYVQYPAIIDILSRPTLPSPFTPPPIQDVSALEQQR